MGGTHITIREQRRTLMSCAHTWKMEAQMIAEITVQHRETAIIG